MSDDELVDDFHQLGVSGHAGDGADLQTRLGVQVVDQPVGADGGHFIHLQPSRSRVHRTDPARVHIQPADRQTHAGELAEVYT